VDSIINIRHGDPTATRSNEISKVRILVLGDSGVGKTTWLQQLCGSQPCDNGKTIGALTHVMLYECLRRHRQFFVEFIDVGGHRSYAVSRHIFYSQINGVIFAFDTANKKSYKNISEWIRELVRVDKFKPIEEGHLGGLIYSPDNNSQDSLHMLAFVVGLKRDLLSDRTYETLKDFGLESASLSAKDSTEELRESMHGFLDRVIQRRHYGNERRSSTGLSRRAYHRFDEEPPDLGDEVALNIVTENDKTNSPHNEVKTPWSSGWDYNKNR
jgi:GTPase SAR1 family protein